MKDETYVFISDVKEKGSIGRSARNRKTHAGKGGRVRLPSDNLSKKELLKMNGECKSYRLNDPMTKEEFQAMPTDLKIAYIKAIRSKYGIPDSHLAKAIGYQQQHFSKMMKKMGIDNGKGAGKRKWDKEGFYAWWHGVDKLPTPTIEEVAITQEEKEEIFFGEEKGYVEDDLPFDIVPVEEPDPIYPKLPELHIALCAEIDELKKRVDELLKVNEELQKRHREDEEHIAWLTNKLCEIEPERDHLAAQMEVVRLIFGGNRNGT